MRFIKEATELAVVGIRGIPGRRGASLVTVIGVTSVVGVLVSLLAMREGSAPLGNDGAGAENVVVLGRGATSIAQSVLSRETVSIIEDAPALKRAPDGRPYLAASTIVSVDAMRRNGRRGSVLLVGLTSGSTLLHPAFRIVAGRLYRPAVHELIVSDYIQRIFRGMEVGKHIMLHGIEWTIVGAFTGGDSLASSTLRGDAETVLAAFGRNTFQEVDAQLQSAASFQAFKAALLSNPAIAVDVKTLAQSREETYGGLNRLLDFIAFAIGGVMGGGAVCGALGTLYASVDARRHEIATLRAIGFRGGPIVVSILIEGVVLALPGAAVGACLSWALFNGHVVSTQGLVFPLMLTAHVLWIGTAWALAIGLLGASLPALQAARMSVSEALRTS